jgi:hypothetical protein
MNRLDPLELLEQPGDVGTADHATADECDLGEAPACEVLCGEAGDPRGAPGADQAAFEDADRVVRARVVEHDHGARAREARDLRIVVLAADPLQARDARITDVGRHGDDPIGDVAIGPAGPQVGLERLHRVALRVCRQGSAQGLHVEVGLRAAHGLHVAPAQVQHPGAALRVAFGGDRHGTSQPAAARRARAAASQSSS